MQVGLSLPQWGLDTGPDAIRDAILTAERVGFDSLWVGEHLIYPTEPRNVSGIGQPVEQHRSCYMATEVLAYAAAITERVRLGTSVLVSAMHRPVMLAKQLATVDQLSGGRLVVGIGMGWSIEEHELSGAPFEHRGERFEDFIATMRACWGDDPVEHDGPFFSVPHSEVMPKPYQPAGPPILYATKSRSGLERTARDADGWNPSGNSTSLDDIVRMRNQLNERAKDLGRPQPYTVLRAQWRTSIDQMIDDVHAVRSAGIDELVIELIKLPTIKRASDWQAHVEQAQCLVEAKTSG
jgi:probable F420-dependent oxidoreductase